MNHEMLAQAGDLLPGTDEVIIDCRFSLADPEEGRRQYEAGHIPGAHYLDLDRDLSGPVHTHGGRHPLPDPVQFAETLARCGIGPDTQVVAYDGSRFAFAARLWWLMRALGYRPPRLLDGGYQAWLDAGGKPSKALPAAVEAPRLSGSFAGHCDVEGLRQAQAGGAVLVDAREALRYQGLEEPIDPVAGHIPGALNYPWQEITDETGSILDEARLRRHWGETLEAEQLIVYCGSGVTACVNLFSLALLGREDGTLYAGSWSDWCSHL